ncbi:MAG: hypothetical protein L3J10_04310 [Sulfurimonas sp.]|nr:hypothetical protein [Sulfurimonas sp.]
MDLVTKLKTKKENMLDILGNLTTMKKVKLFEDEISEMTSDNFSLPLQIEILNKVLNIEINYNTYYSYFNKNIKSKKEINTKLDKTKSSSIELLNEAKNFVKNANIPEIERSKITNGKSLFNWINKKIIELTKANQKIEKLTKNRYRKED